MSSLSNRVCFIICLSSRIGANRCTSSLDPTNSEPDEGSGAPSKYCTDCAPIAKQAELKAKAKGSGTLRDSAKIRKILQLMREIDERSDNTEKTIIFSQFTSMLDIIQDFLDVEGIKYVRCENTFPTFLIVSI
jgi:SNF2 family DNA or RNA helicase